MVIAGPAIGIDWSTGNGEPRIGDRPPLAGSMVKTEMVPALAVRYI